MEDEEKFMLENMKNNYVMHGNKAIYNEGDEYDPRGYYATDELSKDRRSFVRPFGYNSKSDGNLIHVPEFGADFYPDLPLTQALDWFFENHINGIAIDKLKEKNRKLRERVRDTDLLKKEDLLSENKKLKMDNDELKAKCELKKHDELVSDIEFLSKQNSRLMLKVRNSEDEKLEVRKQMIRQDMYVRLLSRGMGNKCDIQLANITGKEVQDVVEDNMKLRGEIEGLKKYIDEMEKK